MRLLKIKALPLWAVLPIFIVLSSGCHKQYLTGYYTWDEFQTKAEWKKFVDEDYDARAKFKDSLATLDTDDSVKVKLFLGTYCPDSKKWVPRFFRLKPLIPVSDVSIISVDTTKKDERGLAQASNIEKIPTFIFLKSGEEIGRITEKPKGRMERHLYRILKKP